MKLKLLRRVKNMQSNPVAPPVIEQRRPVEVASSRKSLAPRHYNPLVHAGLNIQNLLNLESKKSKLPHKEVKGEG